MKSLNNNIICRGFYEIHRPTDHLTLTHQLTNSLTTDPLTHRPNNHRSTDKLMFKRLGRMKTLILQNVNTAGNIENFTLVYLFE